MGNIATKDLLLEDAGYVYDLDRDIYVNRKTRTVFSLEFVEDNGERTIEERLRQSRSALEGGEWRIHFNAEPSKAVREDLFKLLG